MPPKPKYTKEIIISAALKVIEKQGYNTLSVHKIAAEMGSSTQPIYSNYNSFQDLKNDLWKTISENFSRFMKKDYGGSSICNFAIAYVLSARDNPALFLALSSTEVRVVETPESARNVYLDLWKRMQKDPEFEGADLNNIHNLFIHANIYIQGFAHEISRHMMDDWDEEKVIEFTRTAIDLLAKVTERS